MASNEDQSVFQCTGCHEELNLKSKTLPCLHSFCSSCLAKHFNEDTNGESQCPECQESLTLDELSLSSFLVKSLRRRQLESTDWKCKLCSDDGNDSTARFWCHACKELYCIDCNRQHKRFQSKHNSKDLDEIVRRDIIKAMTEDMCLLHQETKVFYCERCNVCLCDACYKSHSAGPPGCSSHPLSVRDEASKKLAESPVLFKKMSDLKESLRNLNERTRNYGDELNSDCNSKCMKLRTDSDEMIENIKRETNKLCDEIRQKTADQVKKWHQLLEENDNILKQLEIWLLNMKQLFDEPQEDVDFVCGLHILGSKLSCQLQKSIGPEEKCHLEVTFASWWLQALDQLKSENVGSLSLTTERLPKMNFVFEKEWSLRGANSIISSIHVSKEDHHVFLCDYGDNTSILEFTEGGDFVCECKLSDRSNIFRPFGMCPITSNSFIVVCGNENKLIILERKKNPPYLQINKVIYTEMKSYSICLVKNSIFVSDLYFNVDSITKECERIKNIKIGGSQKSRYLNRIRVDPSSGNFWGAELESSELFCFDSNGIQIRSEKTEEEITDFCLNEFGDLYYCNSEGIFSLSTKKILHKFVKSRGDWPLIFVLRNKMFLFRRIDGKDLIKIFNIFH